MPELAGILRDQRDNLPVSLTPEQQHAVRDIIVCRTPDMERGALYLCVDCGASHFSWQSCGNRHCPKCGNDKITRWLNKRQEEILPIDYYMVTFTLPNELHSLCQRHPKEVYDAFFRESASSLKELAMNKRFVGGKIGMIGTLQTWRRDGEFHPHIHFLVPGGGLSPDGEYWLFPKNHKFLVAEKPLAKLFKNRFKAALDNLKLVGQVHPDAWRKNWVADCENVGGGMSSFKYLGPYMQRVFISNNRIEKYDGENVTFRYEESKSRRTASRTMNALAFIMMFLKHVLPAGFQKTRYYGFLGNAEKKKICQIRSIILISRGQPPIETEIFIATPLKCKKCGGPMKLTQSRERSPPPGAIII
jgi:predicted RNA-binding Zn-ribbon protein involved in translation (DUF1610 family)